MLLLLLLACSHPDAVAEEECVDEAPVDGGSCVTDAAEHPELLRFVKLLDLHAGADLIALPDGRLLASDMAGTISLVDPAVPALVDQIRYPDGYTAMLSLALDPQFGDGEHDYLYTNGMGSAGVSRYPLTLDPLGLGERQPVFDPGCEAETEVRCHGDLLWWSGEAGRPILYVATNQGPETDHQDSGNLGSKLLAIDVDPTTGEGRPAFSVGNDNDFVVAIGLRNPWRLADCGAGICIADPGEDTWDEIDLYTHAGQNFGWPDVEGPEGPYDRPIFSAAQVDPQYVEADPLGSGALGIGHAPFVGLRVSDTAYGGRLAGRLLHADMYDGWVRALALDDDGEVGTSASVAHQFMPMAMAETGGTVYAIDMPGGLYALQPWDDGPRPDAECLSATHYADAMPYRVERALYSNGADKERRIHLPAGARIATGGDEWVYPAGTEVFKTFSVGGAPVETRMLQKTCEGWRTATYLWDGDEAYRSDGTRTTVTAADGSAYIVPSDAACQECHDATRGRETPLMDPFMLGDTGLTDLLPLFDALPGPAPQPEGSAVEQEARAYLHVNCSFCHRPGAITDGTGPLEFDLRYDADPGLVGTMSSYWTDISGHNQLLVNPEDPPSSVLIQVMQAGQMPYTGIFHPDTAGIEAIEAWIAGLDG